MSAGRGETGFTVGAGLVMGGGVFEGSKIFAAVFAGVSVGKGAFVRLAMGLIVDTAAAAVAELFALASTACVCCA